MREKNISFLVLLSILFSVNIVFAEEKNDIYEKYKKDVETNCLEANFYIDEDKGNKFIYKYEKYQKYYPSVKELENESKVKYLLSANKSSFGLEAIKIIYRDNQNEIYKCGLISAQFKGIKTIEQNLKLDKTGTLKSLIDNKLKPKLERLKNTNKQCKFENNNLTISKKQILDQSTFELCKYSYYLDYLNNYYDNLNNVLGINQTENNKANSAKYDPNFITGLQSQIKRNINNEKLHTFKIYPMAFTAYSEYQTHYPIHIMLELLKDNLIVYREYLYKVLSPINQVVYKFINAMSK